MPNPIDEEEWLAFPPLLNQFELNPGRTPKTHPHSSTLPWIGILDNFSSLLSSHPLELHQPCSPTKKQRWWTWEDGATGTSPAGNLGPNPADLQWCENYSPLSRWKTLGKKQQWRQKTPHCEVCPNLWIYYWTLLFLFLSLRAEVEDDITLGRVYVNRTQLDHIVSITNEYGLIIWLGLNWVIIRNWDVQAQS